MTGVPSGRESGVGWRAGVWQSVGRPPAQVAQVPQARMSVMTTRVPGAMSSTPAPTDTTRPAASWPRTSGGLPP